MEAKLDLITLFVDDMDSMVAFYRDAIGFQIKRYKAGSPFASFDTGSIRFSLYARDKQNELYDQSTVKPHGINGTTALSVLHPSKEALEEAVQQALDKRAKPMHTIRDEPWGIRSLTVTDPEGNLVELYAELR